MTRPSWQDFGTHDESAHPRLWDGVVGAWCPSLGPTGSRLHDMSGRSNWGTLTNMDNATDWVVSDGQYALDIFDDQYINCGTMQDDALNYPFSMSCWVRQMSGATSDFSPFSKSRQADGYAGVQMNIASNVLNAYWNGAYRAFGATAVTNRATWTQLAICWTGAQAQVIVNGKIDSTGNTAVGPSAAATELNIGRYENVVNRSIRGQIDDCMIWRRCLRVNEWAELYRLGRGGMYERKRRTIRRLTPEQAGFRPYWVLNRNQIIGGGLR
jgi:hypothetical protein